MSSRSADPTFRASADRCRALFESMDEGACVIEVAFDEAGRPVDYRFLEVNPAFEHHTGIVDAEGRWMRDIAPAHEQHWFDIYGRVALTGEPVRFENTAAALGRHFEAHAFRVGDPDRREVAVIFKDITTQKRTEAERERLFQELRAAQERMSAELDATTRLLKIGSLFLKDGNLESVLGEIVEAAIAICGADFGNIQLLDRKSGDLKIVAHRGFPGSWLTFWERVGAGQGACGTALERRKRVVIEDIERSSTFMGRPELDVQRAAGVRAVQSTPIVGRAGQPIGMLSTHSKTPGKPSESALRLLDLLVRQAADILERAQAEEALQSANARLVEADRHKDSFLGMLSHELRNPLAPIRNGIYILERAAPGGEQSRRALSVIDRQVGHLTRLVDDLLDVTRLTRGKVRLDREPTDLNDLVARAVDDHRGTFDEAGISLSFSREDDAVWVVGDRTRLAQVIGNLLQNAAKFTPHGGETSVSVHRNPARGEASIRVRDTGRGIAPEILPRLFVPFTQADTTLDRSKGGLGLGLALAKGLVEMHHGSITVTSAGPDRGAVFTVSLPLAPAPGDRSQAYAQRPSAAGRRVLIIEDNEDAGHTLAELLSLAGATVQVEPNGIEGIASARRFRPDVVVCDIGLPEMTGYEIAQAIRADPTLSEAVLIAWTGYAGPEDVARAQRAGFDAHLAKPADIEAVANVLRDVASREPRRPGPRTTSRRA